MSWSPVYERWWRDMNPWDRAQFFLFVGMVIAGVGVLACLVALAVLIPLAVWG